ncbi:hypothetical protein [Hymenobacter volaticus]|uniref:Uncharacterized protein n=1 Tax=Hymenobacter volaticus TaxID=2932254 RepID=A0ABY4GF09_9BACT|nr:hypothetical protein [Hymenobacter volaticus]UOQ68949.1 hypothetical protein MUN86_24915 [Hymenobacter volaticus]
MQKARESSLAAQVKQRAAKFLRQPLRMAALLTLQPYFHVLQRRRLQAMPPSPHKW